MEKKSAYTPILVILLIVAAYLIGVQTTKIQYLEFEKKNATNTEKQPNAQQDQQQAAKPKENNITINNIKDLFKKPVIKFGDSDKKVLFVEVADPSCPYCHAAAGKNPELSSQMGERFKLSTDGGTYVSPVIEMRKLVDAGKAGFVYIYQNGHGNGELATKALYCAYDQNKFWEAHDKLMTNEGYNLINNEFKNDISQAGKVADYLSDVTDSEKIKSCLESGKYDDRLNADMQLARDLGASGTPGFFVNATNFAGAYGWDDMKSVVEKALK